MALPDVDLSARSRLRYKAARVLDLYERLFDRHPLAGDEYMISADDKSQLHALSRRHPKARHPPGRLRRHGTLAYLGACER